MLTEEENNQLHSEFPGLNYPPPPVSTANWDLASWRKYLTGYLWESHKGQFRNRLTGEVRTWHPLAELMGSLAYNSAQKLNSGKRLRK